MQPLGRVPSDLGGTFCFMLWKWKAKGRFWTGEWLDLTYVVKISPWCSIETLEGQTGCSNPTCPTPKLGSSLYFHLHNLYYLYNVLCAVETLKMHKKKHFFSGAHTRPPHSGLSFSHPTKVVELSPQDFRLTFYSHPGPESTLYSYLLKVTRKTEEEGQHQPPKSDCYFRELLTLTWFVLARFVYIHDNDQ